MTQTTETTKTIQMLPIEYLSSHPQNPRKDLGDLQELTESIRENGWFPMDKVYCPRCQGEGLIGALDPDSLGFMEIDCPDCIRPSQRFANLWNNLNAKRGYGWDKNPWVWVYAFRRIEKEEAYREAS